MREARLLPPQLNETKAFSSAPTSPPVPIPVRAPPRWHPHPLQCFPDPLSGPPCPPWPPLQCPPLPPQVPPAPPLQCPPAPPSPLPMVHQHGRCQVDVQVVRAGAGPQALPQPEHVGEAELTLQPGQQGGRQAGRQAAAGLRNTQYDTARAAGWAAGRQTGRQAAAGLGNTLYDAFNTINHDTCQGSRVGSSRQAGSSSGIQNTRYATAKRPTS